MRDVIIGLDLATRSGWGVIDLDGSYLDSGAWPCSPRVRRPKSDRWIRFSRALADLLRQYEGRVAVVAIERPIGNGNHKGGAVPAVAWGLLALAELAAQARDIASVCFPPSRVKKSATGNGHASKAEVAEAMSTRFLLPDLREGDEADGLAVAVTAWRRLDRESLECGEVVELEVEAKPKRKRRAA